MRRDITRILTPVDFFPGSEAAAAYAFWLAGRLGARLKLLHVLGSLGQTAAGMAPGEWVDAAIAEREAREQAERDLAALAARLAQGAGGGGGSAPETAVVTVGESTADAILEAAREASVDLVVMGTHGRSGLRRLILGSVAEQVVRRADCPVLTVRSRSAPETAAAAEA